MILSSESKTPSAVAGIETHRFHPEILPSSSEHEAQLSWVAVQTRPHHEKSAAKHLLDQSIDCYLPLYKSRRHWSHHRTSIIEMPLFPTYLFAHTSPRTRIQVLRTPGVIGIVGRGATGDLISDQEIQILRAGLPLRNPEPHEIAAGENVRIVSGPLMGMQGVIERYKSSLRVVISVPMIRQSVSVEVAACEVEAACSTRVC